MPKSEKTKKKAASKVEKQIHPKSRKASQLAKIIHHEEKKQQRKGDFNSKMSVLKEKILWFKNELDSEKEKYSLSEVSQIISRYLNRFQERLEEIKEQNDLYKARGRHGRYHASEEEAIKMVVEKEKELFLQGKLEAPDLTNVPNVKCIREWNGETKQLLSVKLRNFRKEEIETDQKMET